MAFFESHDWNTGFVCWTLLLCLVVRYLCLCFVFVYYLEYEFVYIWLSQRFITIFTLSAVVNLMRKNIHPIGWNEQFIMAYGGLRGAVGFSLVRYLCIRMVTLPGQQNDLSTQHKNSFLKTWKSQRIPMLLLSLKDLWWDGNIGRSKAECTYFWRLHIFCINQYVPKLTGLCKMNQHFCSLTFAFKANVVNTMKKHGKQLKICSVIPKLVIASQCLFLQVNMVNSQAVPAARMFLTTTLAVVMFTVFAQVLFLFVLFCCCCHFCFCCSFFLFFFHNGPWCYHVHHVVGDI